MNHLHSSAHCFLIRPVILLLALLLLLAGCVNIPFMNPQPTRTPAEIKAEATQQARRLEQQGNYLAAAKSYMQLAAAATPPLQQDYHLSAIEAYLQGNMLPEARIELSRLNLSTAPELMPRQHLVFARLEIAEGNPTQALQRLTQLNPHGEWQVPYQQVRIAALEAQGNFLQALQARIALDMQLGSNRAAILANHDQLWKLILQLPTHHLTDLSRQHQNNELTGWIALGLLARNSSLPRLTQLLNDWQARYPNHRANIDIVPMLRQGKQPTLSTANVQVAVLLPLSGQFKMQAEAIRDGFLAAWYSDQNSRTRPQVDVYDVTDKPITQLYQHVIEKGADVVIGPLEKDSIMQLMQGQTQLAVPTLALNFVNAPTVPANLYQFGLAPDREAIEVATRAWADGYRRAAILVPEGAWGERLGKSYRDTWQQRGGQVMNIQFYNNQNVSTAVRTMSRSGADVLLLAAFQPQARSIVPFVEYHNTRAQMPIYATSHVYSNAAVDTNLDSDLNGVVFGDMPWILTPTPAARQLQGVLQQQWPDSYSQLKRIYAFGAELYQLLPQLQQRINSGVQHQGYTGLLVFNPKGEIERSLIWARFVNGAPTVLNDGFTPANMR